MTETDIQFISVVPDGSRKSGGPVLRFSTKILNGDDQFTPLKETDLACTGLSEVAKSIRTPREAFEFFLEKKLLSVILKYTNDVIADQLQRVKDGSYFDIDFNAHIKKFEKCRTSRLQDFES